jgi:hypothetical protein
VSGWFGSGRGGANDQAFGVQALGKVFWTAPKDDFALRGDDKNAELERPQAKRFTACWATAKDAGFSYRVDFGEGRSLTVEERPSPVAGLGEPAFVRRLTIQNNATDRHVCFCLNDVEKRVLHINSAGTPRLHSQFDFQAAKQEWSVLTDPPVKDISREVGKGSGQVWLEIPPGAKQPLTLLYVRRSSGEQPPPEGLRKLLKQPPQLGK